MLYCLVMSCWKDCPVFMLLDFVPFSTRYRVTPDQSVSCYQQKMKGTQGIIEIENPNLVKAKNLKAKDIDVSSAFFFFLILFD